MKIVNYKNIATGLAESYEVGSRGDRKRRADPKHYTCLNPEVLPKPKPAGEKVADPATLKRVLDDPQTYEEIKQEKKQEKPI